MIRLSHNTGSYVPYPSKGSSLTFLIASTEEMLETEPTVYHTHPRRLECLTIFRCHSKSGAFSPVVFTILSVCLIWSLNARPSYEDYYASRS